MNKPTKELIALAKGQLIGRYKPAIFAVLLVTIIEFIVMSVVDTVSSSTVLGYLLFLAIELIVDLLCGVLLLGQSRLYLKLARFDNTASISDIFYGFKENMDKAIMVQAVFTVVSFLSSLPAILINFGIFTVEEGNFIKVKVALWFLTFTVNFVLKLYLGMAFYILCDNPNMSATEVITRAYSLMDKQKGRLFLAYLSLVPLYILGFLALGFGALWVIALQQIMLADFYLCLIGEEPAKEPTIPDSDHSDYSTSGMR